MSLIKLGQAGAEAAIVTLLTEMQWQLESCKLDSHKKALLVTRD